MKILFCLMGLLCFLLSIGQEGSSRTRPLSIGDSVPDLVFTNVINHPVSKIQLSDISDKLIILDFWSSWCAACIGQFPHMDSLRQQFGNQLQLILVNGKSKLSADDKPKIEKIIRLVKQRTRSPLNIPVIFDNPVLDTLFPYNYIPHEVWIKSNKVVAITSALEVNEANINALLTGSSASMRTKTDMVSNEKPFSLLKPVDLQKTGPYYFQAILTGYQDGLHGMGDRRDSANSSMITGIYYYNESLETLLRDAYTNTDKFQFPSNRLVLEVRDPAPFQEHNDTSIYRYSYCYEVSATATTYPRIRAYMQQDISRAFNLEVKSERRTVPCLVVEASPALKRSITKGGEPFVDWESQSMHKYIRNYTVPQVMQFLDRMSSIPIIDETGSTISIDMDLPERISNVGQLIKALTKAGFNVIQQQRTLEVTVVSDR